MRTRRSSRRRSNKTQFGKRRMSGGMCGPMCIPPLTKALVGVAGAGAIGSSFMSSSSSENVDMRKKHMKFTGSKESDKGKKQITIEMYPLSKRTKQMKQMKRTKGTK